MATRPDGDPPVSFRPFQITLLELLVIFAVIALLLGLLIPAIQSARAQAIRTSCFSRHKGIVCGVHVYHDAFKCLPLTYTTGPNGEPRHGWRVRTMPYIDSSSSYDKYSFQEAWNGPRNRTVFSQDSDRHYSCPADTRKSPSDTNYLVVVDPTTIWPGEQIIHLSDVADGTGNTLMLVETVNSGIHWLEPREFDMGVARLGVNPSPGPGIGSHHRGGAVCSLADGSGRFLSSDISPRVLESLLTKSGGEKVDLDAL